MSQEKMENLNQTESQGTPKQPPGFMTYDDQIDIIEELTDEQAGELWKALMRFKLYGEVYQTQNPIVRMAFKVMSNKISIDIIKYQERCKKNKDNIDKRWEKEKRNELFSDDDIWKRI